MAVIQSFETHCHLQAIERDLIPIVARLEAELLLNEEIMSLEFHEALKDLKNEVFMQNLADELNSIVQVVFITAIVDAWMNNGQPKLEDLR